MKEVTIYKCPECNSEYDDYGEAAECYKDCVDIEVDEIIKYKCDECHTTYNTKTEALECCTEAQAAKLRMKRAQEHPNQTRLK